MLGLLITPITGLITEIIKSRTAINKEKTKQIQTKTSLQKARFKQKTEIKTAQTNWEAIHAQNAGNRWRFDYTLIFLTFPVLLIFFSAFFYTPWLENIELAFTSIRLMPDHWEEVMFIAILASFGVRGIEKFRLK